MESQGMSVDEFLNDDYYKQFLKENFDVKTHASQVLQDAAVSDQLAKLNKGLSSLDNLIQQQVSEHYEDLLKHSSGVETLESITNMIQTHLQGLMASVERIMSKISEPYSKLQTQIVMLNNLQSSCELLRRIIRILSLSKRLQVQLQAGNKEITKTAQTLSELDHLTKDVDLSGIEVIEKDQKFIYQARIEIEKQAELMLKRGLEVQNQSQVGTALQVFHNLGLLQNTVEKVLENIRENLLKALKRALNMEQLCNVPSLSSQQLTDSKLKAPGRVTMPSTGSSPAFRTSLWTNMEKLMEQIFSYCAQVQQLQKVLAKKRDPVTHICFLDELNQSKSSHLVQRYWTQVTTLLTEEFGRAANDSSHIKQAFEGEYPKLLRLCCDLWNKLQQFNQEMTLAANIVTGEADDMIEAKVEETNNLNAEEALRHSLLSFQNAYLSSSLSRLFDPVNLMFSGSDVIPTVDECENVIKVVQSELMVSMVDTKLCQLIAKNVTKTIQLIAVKAEQLIITDGDASQVIGPPTAAQKTNASVVNLLHYLDRSFRRCIMLLTGLPQDCNASIIDSLKCINTLMQNSLQPLLTSISDAVEAILLTMHDEDFATSQIPEGGTAPCSLYMKELTNFLSRAASDYIPLYHCPEFLHHELCPVAARCLDLFVRHVSLVRPLGEGGKLKLAADFAQMESAIAVFYDRPAELGRSYRILRSFRPLLFQTIDHLSVSPVVGDVIPYSIILHFLFARAPPELKSPQQGAGWSVVRYSKWLDEHSSEKERLSLIQGALESYVQSVRQRQGKEFVPEYSVMLQLLQKALANGM